MGGADDAAGDGGDEDDGAAADAEASGGRGKAALGQGLVRAARRAARAAGLGLTGTGDDGAAGDMAVAASMAAAVAAFCGADRVAPAAAPPSPSPAAQLYDHHSAWTPLGAAARAVLLHPAAVPALLRELEVGPGDRGTGKFGADTRRAFGTDDADGASDRPVPAGASVLGDDGRPGPRRGQADPLDVATSAHTVAWQGLGRPDVDGCPWAHVLAHTMLRRADDEVEASDAAAAPSAGPRLDPRLGRLTRIFVTRQALVWKDSDALAMLHRATLAAAAAWDVAERAAHSGNDDDTTAPAAVESSPWLTAGPRRDALLAAAFGSADEAGLCAALARAARVSAYTVGSPALEAGTVGAASGAAAAAWEAEPPLAHYGSAVRAEFSDEVKEVAEEELREAAGAAEAAGAVPGGGAAAGGAGGGGLASMAGRGIRVRLGDTGVEVDVDDLLSRAAAMGMQPEELAEAMAAAHSAEGGAARPGPAAAGGAQTALPADTDPLSAFFQTMLPWVSGPEAPAPGGPAAAGSAAGGSALLAPMTDEELAAELQAAEHAGMDDDEAWEDGESTDDEA